MLRFSCPKCAAVLEVADQFAGNNTACPKCKQFMRVPHAKKDTKVVSNKDVTEVAKREKTEVSSPPSEKPATVGAPIAHPKSAIDRTKTVLAKPQHSIPEPATVQQRASIQEKPAAPMRPRPAAVQHAPRKRGSGLQLLGCFLAVLILFGGLIGGGAAVWWFYIREPDEHAIVNKGLPDREATMRGLVAASDDEVKELRTGALDGLRAKLQDGPEKDDFDVLADVVRDCKNMSVRKLALDTLFKGLATNRDVVVRAIFVAIGDKEIGESAETYLSQARLDPVGEMDLLGRVLADTKMRASGRIKALTTLVRGLQQNRATIVRILFGILDDGDATVRKAAWDEIGRVSLDPIKDIGVLMNFVQAPSPTIKVLVLETLVKSDVRDADRTRVMIAVLTAVDDADASVRTTAMDGLTKKHSWDAKKDFEALQKLVSHPNTDLRKKAVMVLVDAQPLTDQVAALLKGALKDKDKEVRL